MEECGIRSMRERRKRKKGKERKKTKRLKKGRWNNQTQIKNMKRKHH